MQMITLNAMLSVGKATLSVQCARDYKLFSVIIEIVVINEDSRLTNVT